MNMTAIDRQTPNTERDLKQKAMKDFKIKTEVRLGLLRSG
jgi:hypothetical protein